MSISTIAYKLAETIDRAFYHHKCGFSSIGRKAVEDKINLLAEEIKKDVIIEITLLLKEKGIS